MFFFFFFLKASHRVTKKEKERKEQAQRQPNVVIELTLKIYMIYRECIYYIYDAIQYIKSK